MRLRPPPQPRRPGPPAVAAAAPTPRLLDALADLLRRTGGVRGLKRLLDAVEVAGGGG
jgi:hypothetical protein